MKKSKLATLTMDFAVEIINLGDNLKAKNEWVISNQISRSGTSIGANVFEANYASSRADFINKLRISLKEANETLYWLELLNRTEKIDNRLYALLNKDCLQIRTMLVKSINTAESNAIE